jgi:hypothetical protein
MVVYIDLRLIMCTVRYFFLASDCTSETAVGFQYQPVVRSKVIQKRG